MRLLLSFILLFFSFPQAHAEGLFVDANEVGRIPILEYHQVGPKEERWSRWDQYFAADLEFLYNNNYRAISMKDFMRGWIDLRLGMKPVVFTFDDGSPTQLVIKNGVVDPYSAVGLMDSFLKIHPDFGSEAIFYVNKSPFPLSDSSKVAIDYLLRTGREIGNHTVSHGNLSSLGVGEVEYQLSSLETYIHEELGFSEIVLDSIAYPFGGIPGGVGLNVLKAHVKLGLLVGSDPTFPSYHQSYLPYAVPRIQAIDEEWKRWFRRESGETGVSSREPIFNPYVSDGDPLTIRVSSESERKMVRLEGLVEGTQVVVGSTVEMPAVPAYVRSFEEEISSDEKIMEYVVDSIETEEIPVYGAADVSPVPEVFPYQSCGNEDAQEWIDYKVSGLWSRVRSALGNDFRRWNFDNFIRVAGKWVRFSLHEGSRKGIYLNAANAPGSAGDYNLMKFHSVDGNFIVFDVNKSTLRRMTPEKMKTYQDFVSRLQDRNIYVVSRLVVAIDSDETAVNPWKGIQRIGGGIWKDNKGEGWLDLSHEGSRDYIVGLVRQLVQIGVDEVQLDYIRFPSDGDLSSVRYAFDQREYPRWKVIRDVIRDVRKELVKSGTYLGVDFLGVVAWNNGYDGNGTGQKVECLSPYVDAIYPMSYPSHFGPGFSGHSLPAADPYYFVGETAKKFEFYSHGTKTNIRTWLQAFSYKTPNYNTEYVRLQAQAVWDGSHDGYVLWNAGNNYEVAWGGMVGNEGSKK